MHKAGFVNIIGKPNVGKSTLMNAMVGERLSIITEKAQTTRHRIKGIVNAENHQIIFSDTPGILEPQYQLQKSMMNYVEDSLEDADIILFLVEAGEEHFADGEIFQKIINLRIPIILLVNKIDKWDENQQNQFISRLEDKIQVSEIIPVSALSGTNVEKAFEAILKYLPEHPPFFPKDALTDRPERFFAAEIIREKIFSNYKKEIPYSCEVVITSFKEEEAIIRIQAEIYVERKTQRGILIGKSGEAIKQTGIEARKDLERFFQKHVHLEQYIRVAEKWRKDKNMLRKFGF